MTRPHRPDPRPTPPLTRAPATTRWYRVRVTFREPTWELATNQGPREPFLWTHDVRAAGPEDAKAQALRHFRALEEQSSVGWVREVSDTAVEMVE